MSFWLKVAAAADQLTGYRALNWAGTSRSCQGCIRDDVNGFLIPNKVGWHRVQEYFVSKPSVEYEFGDDNLFS